MLYQVFAPPPQLASYVRFFWALEAEVLPGEEFVHRSIADGSVEMVFHYRSAFDEITGTGTIETSPLASIQAQATTYRRFLTRESFGIFGAYLYPFAIPRFFSLPASDFTNISPDLGSVFGREGRLLDEQVVAANNNDGRVKIVSRFLAEKLDATRRELPDVYHSVHQIMEAAGSMSIADLASEYRVSTRQFERRFKEVAGMSPNSIPV